MLHVDVTETEPKDFSCSSVTFKLDVLVRTIYHSLHLHQSLFTVLKHDFLFSSEMKLSWGYSCFTVCLFLLYQNWRYLVHTTQRICLLFLVFVHPLFEGLHEEKWKQSSFDCDRFSNSKHNINFIENFSLQHKTPEHIHVIFIPFYVFVTKCNVCLIQL